MGLRSGSRAGLIWLHCPGLCGLSPLTHLEKGRHTQQTCQDGSDDKIEPSVGKCIGTASGKEPACQCR